MTEEQFTCTGCKEIKDTHDDTAYDFPKHWSRDLMMGKCIVCEVQFACADCCAAWTFQERHYCKNHSDKYDINDPRWRSQSDSDCSDSSAPQPAYAKCCVDGCHGDTNQRYDKYGGIAEHKKTKETFCVEHAIEAIRTKRVPDWDFIEYGVDEENPPDDYDCIAINPRCDKCEMRLCEDALDSWLKNTEEEPGARGREAQGTQGAKESGGC